MRVDTCITLLFVHLLLIACAVRPVQPAHMPEVAKPELPECMQYRHMMTAPMPPDAVARLRQACEDAMARQ